MTGNFTFKMYKLTIIGITFLPNRNVHNSNALRNRSNQYEYDVEILPYSRTRLIIRPLAFTLLVS